MSKICILGLLAAGSVLSQVQWEWRNPLPQGNQLYSVGYENGQFWATGDAGTLLKSADGVTWTGKKTGIQDQTNNSIYSLCFGGGKYVAVGAMGKFAPPLMGKFGRLKYRIQKIVLNQ